MDMSVLCFHGVGTAISAVYYFKQKTKAAILQTNYMDRPTELQDDLVYVE